MSGDDIEVDMSEVEALAADLGKASFEVSKRASQVVRKTAFDMEAQAKKLSPFDTGTLRNSISTTIGLGGLTAEVGPTVNYGIYLEYGTRRMPAQPYMSPAAETVTPAFIEAIEQLGGDMLT